jgi:hypothetical protein
MAALEFRGRNAGGHGEGDGVRGRDGVLSSFLGASRVAIRPIRRFLLNQLKIRSFMPRWCFKCVLLRAKEETLWRAEFDGSSNLATADGSSGFWTTRDSPRLSTGEFAKALPRRSYVSSLGSASGHDWSRTILGEPLRDKRRSALRARQQGRWN